MFCFQGLRPPETSVGIADSGEKGNLTQGRNTGLLLRLFLLEAGCMNGGQSDESVLHAEEDRVWAIYLTTGLCLECSSSPPADPQLFGFIFFSVDGEMRSHIPCS